MLKLTHFRLCPHSRSIRLALGELEMAAEFAEERPFDYRPAFLALNPAGELPVLQVEGALMLSGAYAISEYLAETAPRHPVTGHPSPLFPGNIEARAEIRRLVDWWHGKFHREVTRELLQEKVYLRLMSVAQANPDPAVLRAVRANLRYHLSYVAFLAHQRRWLAGDEMSFADLAAGAHLSVVDFLVKMAWEDYPAAKAWYVRMKSRPSFRTLLADRVAGTPPPVHYTDLDF